MLHKTESSLELKHELKTILNVKKTSSITLEMFHYKTKLLNLKHDVIIALPKATF